MKVRIHRGAKEIGGNCVEVESGGSRIVIDVGRPLAAERDEFIPLPDITGFTSPDDSLLGIVISHGHQDHWGLIGQVLERVPVYIGEAANSILTQAAFFSTGVKLVPTRFLRHRCPFTIGPFTITPFLNDHSAFDTYSLLIEAGASRLFYTADLQGHGRKAALFEELLRDPPPNVDVCLLEGTNVRPGADRRPEITEAQVEDELTLAIAAAPGIVLAMYPAQNIDRLVTWFRACRRAHRSLIVDLYTALIAKATGNEHVRQPGFEDLLMYVPLWQRIRVKESKKFELVDSLRSARIFRAALKSRTKQLVFTFRQSMIREIERAECLDGAVAVWSQWSGYLDRPDSKPLHDFLKRHGIPLIQIHASGHAYVRDLQRLTNALAAKRIVPIHSLAPHRFEELFDRVELHADGEWWEV